MWSPVTYYFYVWSKNNISLKIFIDIESHTIVRKYVGFFYKYGCSHNPNQATSGESETRVFLLYLEFGHHLGCPSYNVARRYIHQEWGDNTMATEAQSSKIFYCFFCRSRYHSATDVTEVVSMLLYKAGYQCLPSWLYTPAPLFQQKWYLDPQLV